jgi:hypothetical protein
MKMDSEEYVVSLRMMMMMMVEEVEKRNQKAKEVYY